MKHVGNSSCQFLAPSLQILTILLKTKDVPFLGKRRMMCLQSRSLFHPLLVLFRSVIFAVNKTVVSKPKPFFRKTNQLGKHLLLRSKTDTGCGFSFVWPFALFVAGNLPDQADIQFPCPEMGFLCVTTNLSIQKRIFVVPSK